MRTSPLILAIDGLANGAVYLLAGLGLVLDLLGHARRLRPVRRRRRVRGAELAAFETGRTPPTIGLVLTLAALAVAREIASLLRRAACGRIPRALLALGRAAGPALRARRGPRRARPGVPSPLHVASAVLLVVPIAPLLARVALQPIADASVLVLLIVVLALHFLLSGLGPAVLRPRGLAHAAARRAAR